MGESILSSMLTNKNEEVIFSGRKGIRLRLRNQLWGVGTATVMNLETLAQVPGRVFFSFNSLSRGPGSSLTGGYIADW